MSTQGGEGEARVQSPENSRLKSFFLQEKPTDMIVLLKQRSTSYAGELSEEAETTYSHAVKVMNRMKEIGLVKCRKKGRKKEYELTEKGHKVAEMLESLFNEVEGMTCPKMDESNPSNFEF